MNLHRIGLLLPFLGLAVASPAQLRINELFLDPPGSNAGNQIIELINTSDMPFTAPSGWAFCIRPTYPPIPGVEVPPGGVVQLHIGASGTNTSSDWYLPSVTVLPPDGEFAIYSTNVFGASQFIRDFVSWGNGACVPFCSRIDVAVLAGLWPSINTHLDLPDEGSSIASRGSGTGPARFFVDSTPTLGSFNELASFETFGSGCQAMGSVPALDIAAGQLPWVNESFTVRLSDLPQAPAVPFGILGFSDSVWGPFNLPQDLVTLGFPGCTQFVSVDFSQPLANAGGTASWTIHIPLDPNLTGLEFFTQGVVLFGAQGAVSNASRGIIGGPR